MSTETESIPSSPPASTSCPSRCCDAMRKMLPRTILITCYVIYIVIGGLVFSLVEEPRYEALVDAENSLEEEAEGFMVHDGPAGSDGHNGTMMEAELGQEWTFGNAMLFCMTTISTIGYGHMIPHTAAGKVLCIFYSMFGIPMTFWVIFELGHLYAILVMKIYNKCSGRCCKSRRKRVLTLTLKRSSANGKNDALPPPPKTGSNGSLNAEDKDQTLDLTEASATNATGNGAVNEDGSLNNDVQPGPGNGVGERHCSGDNDAAENDVDDDEDAATDDDILSDVPIFLPPIVFWSYIITSAPMFSWMEGWSFLTSVYFLFISITTIGFGDLVPRSSMGLVSSWFGLIVTAMCIVLSYRRFLCATKWVMAVLDAKINPERNTVHYSNI